MTYLGFKALCIVVGFLVLWSICVSSSLVHSENDPQDQTWSIEPRLYSFDEISSDVLGFEKFSHSADILFSYIFFHLRLLDSVRF